MSTGTIFDYAGMGPSADAGVDSSAPAWKDNTRPSEHAEGYLWQGPWQATADGFAEHCRRGALALAHTGAVVSLRALQRRPVDDVVAHEKNEKRLAALLDASIGRYSAQIFMMVPTERLMEYLLMPKRMPNGQLALEYAEQALVDAHRVFYTVWERDRLSRGALDLMSRVGQCWVACQANADMLVRSGIPEQRVRVVPCPHFADDPHLSLAGRERKPGPVRFYHIGKWEPRKAQDKMLEAFLRAFRPGEAMLFVRSSPLAHRVEGYPQSPQEAMAGLLQLPDVRSSGWTETNVVRSIRIFAQRMTEEQLLVMHREGDVYVSLSRGEGFDMPARDAKLAGNLLLYTPSGGPQDYSDARDVMVPTTGLIPAHEMYEWKNTNYWNYSTADAIAGMRQARLKVLQGYDRSPDARLKRFGAGYVGAQMRQYLAELAEAAKPVAAFHRAWVENRRQEFEQARARHLDELVAADSAGAARENTNGRE